MAASKNKLISEELAHKALIDKDPMAREELARQCLEMGRAIIKNKKNWAYLFKTYAFETESALNLFIVVAFEDWSPERGKFRNYFNYLCANRIIDYLRRETGIRRKAARDGVKTFSLNNECTGPKERDRRPSYLETIPAPYKEPAHNIITEELMAAMTVGLSKKHKKIVHMRATGALIWECAKSVGLSESAGSQVIRRAYENLYNRHKLKDKVCSKCRDRKPREEYYKDKSTRSGIASSCKKCTLNKRKREREKKARAKARERALKQ